LRLWPFAQRALDAVDDCGRAGRGQVGPAPMELVLGTRHELGLSWIVPSLGRIEKSHPGLSLHLYFGSGPDLVLRVRTLEIDCAVTSTRITDPKLEALKLHEEEYVFVGSSSLLQEQPLRNERDAKAHILIDANAELPLFRYWRDAPGGIDSLSFAGIRKMGTISAIRQLVLGGQGVAVLPAYFVDKELRSGKLQVLWKRVKPLSDHFRLVFRADDPKRAYYEALVETMRALPLR